MNRLMKLSMAQWVGDELNLIQKGKIKWLPVIT